MSAGADPMAAKAAFPHLLSEIALGPTLLKNRIVSTGHHTNHAQNLISERLIAYQEARARGGAGLIIAEVAAVHETAVFSTSVLVATGPDCVPGYRRLVEVCRPHGARVFGQLFHPGREIMATADGLLPVAYAPSAVPNERFHVMPVAMTEALIAEVVWGYGRAAGYLAEAGLDGVEIVASHGYLPAQFLNKVCNLRQDRYGGDFEGRLTFLREVVAAVRGVVGTMTLGLRISGDEMEPGGLANDEVSDVCLALTGPGGLDYVSVVAGSSATLGGSVHIAAPMGLEHAYVAPFAATIKARIDKPVLVTGRINQPQVAEQVIASGQADLCGMTRALICDPDMPRKTHAGRLDDIRACIACNQSCIGRAHKGVPISCLQYPESGRELEFGELAPAATPRRVMVIGGGPAGMKAAAVAAARGHTVTLYEKDSRLGGQVLLAERLPAREEFGGLVTNLIREMGLAGVDVYTSYAVTPEIVAADAPDAVVLATGALPYRHASLSLDGAHAVEAWDLLRSRANVGASVAIADWRADWIGLGLAEKLAKAGCRVRLCVNGAMAGETLQLYVRNHYVGRLHKLGVEIRTHLRLFGADSDTAYFQDTLTDEPVMLEGVDTLVLALGQVARDDLSAALHGSGREVIAIGDCKAPRSAEEAVYEGLVAGSRI